MRNCAFFFLFDCSIETIYNVNEKKKKKVIHIRVNSKLIGLFAEILGTRYNVNII